MRTCGGLLSTGNFHSEVEQNYLALGCSLILVHWENKAVLCPGLVFAHQWPNLLLFSDVTWYTKASVCHLGCSRKYAEIFTQDLLKASFDSIFVTLPT